MKCVGLATKSFVLFCKELQKTWTNFLANPIIPVKILTGFFFGGSWKANMKVYMKAQRPEVSQDTPKKQVAGWTDLTDSNIVRRMVEQQPQRRAPSTVGPSGDLTVSSSHGPMFDLRCPASASCWAQLAIRLLPTHLHFLPIRALWFSSNFLSWMLYRGFFP